VKRKSSTPKTLRGKLIDVDDLVQYARSFHAAAKALAGSLHLGEPLSDVDFSPVVNIYRLALELHLKALVLGAGGNLLKVKPDQISICQTHSVSWLAQFVVQIVTAVGWHEEFRCEGISNLDDFKAVVESVNAVDPGAFTYRTFLDSQSNFDPGEFVRKIDALLGLLDATADALAAEWDFRSGVLPELDPDDGSFGPTIQ
jgi:hypothetical protein